MRCRTDTDADTDTDTDRPWNLDYREEMNKYGVMPVSCVHLFFFVLSETNADRSYTSKTMNNDSEISTCE